MIDGHGHSKAEPPSYLEVLSRRNWRTWAWAAGGALMINLALFAAMPCLLDRGPSQTAFERLISQVNVIRIKRPDTPVQQKLNEPPPKQRVTPIPAPEMQPLVRTRLSLPFEINPRLPAGPATLVLPPMEVDSNAPGLQAAFSVGDLDQPLTVMSCLPPIYSLDAKHRGIEGWVTVRLLVNEQGNVDKVDVVEAKPPGLFDASVIRCVSRWRFKPGTVEGMPVKVWAETTVRFELE